VPAYIYLSGFGDIGYDTTEITMKLKTGDENNVLGDHWFYGDNGEGENVEFEQFTLSDQFKAGDDVGIKTINDEIPPPSNTEYILQMRDLLNASEEMPLYYNIKVKELPVTPGNSESIITVDLLLVLPLYFDVSTEAETEKSKEVWPTPDDRKVKAGGKDYIKLFLEQLEDFNEDFEEDLLEDYPVDITYVTMSLAITNEITDDLYIGIDPNREGHWKVFPLENGSASITLTGKEINPSFTPQFVALVKEGEANPGHGPLFIKSFDDNSGFNVEITVEASADLDMKIDF
jgi:hypothetical protein